MELPCMAQCSADFHSCFTLAYHFDPQGTDDILGPEKKPHSFK